MNELHNKTIVLEEMRRNFDKLWSASDTLDAKLQNLLNFLSIIVSIASSIEVSMFQSKVGIDFWYLLFAALILYLIAFLVIIIGLNPYRYLMPISNDWNEIATRYFQPTEGVTLSLFINEYRKRMIGIEKENKPKIISIRLASSLMVLIICLLMLAVPFGLAHPTPTLFEFFSKVKL